MPQSPWDFSNIIMGNRAGEIMGGAIANTGANIGQAIKEYQHNKVMANQAIGTFEGAVQSNPELLNQLQREDANPQVKSAFNKLQKGGTVGVKDAALLSQFAQTFVTGKQQEMAKQMQAMQLAEMQRQQAQQQRVGHMLDAATQASTAPGLSTPLQQNLAADPAIMAAAKARSMGWSPKDYIDWMQTRGATGTGLEPQVRMMNGVPVLWSPKTGNTQFFPQTPEQAGKIEEAKAAAEVSAKEAGGFLSGISDTAESSRSTVGTVARILQLYDEGAQSGWQQPTFTQARAALGRFGLGTDGLATQQEFEKNLNQLSLNFGQQVLKGGGSVSNYERELVLNAQANAGNLPEANKRILGAQMGIAQRAIKLEAKRNELEDRGLSKVEVARELRKFRDSMPIPGIEDLKQYSKPVQEVKYDKQGNAWTKNEKGEIIPYKP